MSKTDFPQLVIDSQWAIADHQCEAFWVNCRAGAVDKDHYCTRGDAPWHPALLKYWNLRFLCRVHHAEATRRRDLYGATRLYLDWAETMDSKLIRLPRLAAQAAWRELSAYYVPTRKMAAMSGRVEWVTVD